MRFTLRQLSYFVAAGETGSVTLASEKVNISQPSVSAAIARLEAEFGLQLFVRHHAQGLSLTSSGERFLVAAKALLEQAQALHDIADEVAMAVTGPLRIGVFRTFAPLIIPDLGSAFLAQYPQVKLEVREGDEASLIEMLKRAEIDLAFTYSMNVPEEVEFEPLAELPTYILLPGAHPLSRRRSLGLAELADTPFVLLDMPLSREYFLSIFQREGLAPNIAARSEHSDTVRSYVASGFGFSLLTARPANMAAVNGGKLAYVRLEGKNPPMVLGLAKLKALRGTRAINAFLDHARERLKSGTLPGMAPQAEASVSASQEKGTRKRPRA
ncbi:MAG: LysR family transcriptional regulator [Parvibaculaceae bacterium]